MKDDPGAELSRALLHRTTHTRNKDPAILQCNMKTAPNLSWRSQSSGGNTSVSHYQYALQFNFKKAMKHLTCIFVQADLNYSYDVSRWKKS